MNLEGRLLGNRYEIMEEIGKGGMATVYKAKCNVLNRYVAIKILRDEFITDNEFIKRFKAEAQSAASLTHPNIVSIYDVANEGDLYYIVMELIQGKTLKQIINEDGVLSWKWSSNIAIQIASALEMAHKNNIVHRDIKPHNIIITEDGVAKVTDFGIAKAVSNSTITAFGTTIGSVHYFSPEHAKGGFTDAKSDLYSLGVVLYEMVTGKVPFDADTPVSIALKHMQEMPVEPMKLNPLLPIAVNNIIMKAMQKDTNLRYQNASEMIRDLNLAIQNPEGNFIDKRSNSDFPTQVLSTSEIKKEEERKRKEEEKEYKRKAEENEKKRKEEEETKRKEEARKRKEERKNSQKVKQAKMIAAGILASIILFVVCIAGAYMFLSKQSVGDVPMPNVVGMAAEDAEKTIKDLKLVYEVESEEYSDEVASGYVIRQNPEYTESYNGEGYKVKEKSKIKVVLSKGKEFISVPKVTGMAREEAEEALKNVNLFVEYVEQTSEKIEAGYVISQEPRAEERVETGTNLTVFVSSGRGIEEVLVPNLFGLSEAAAKEAITSAKLTLNTVITSEDTSKSNGVVLKQDLTPGTKVDENTAITITVNRLPEIKSGTVKINLKSLTNYTVEYTDKVETTTVPKATTIPTTTTVPTTLPAPTAIVAPSANNESIKNTPIATTTTVPTTIATTTPMPTTTINKIEKEPKSVEVLVKVTSQGSEDTVYKRNHKENQENIEAPVSGVGTITIKVYVDNVLKKTEQLNLNSDKPVIEVK